MIMTLTEVQVRLLDLVHNLSPGEEVIIIENNRTVAKLIAPSAEQIRPIPGRGKGTLIIHSEDNEHLADFKEYMP